jgi:predicted Zn-dependent protease
MPAQAQGISIVRDAEIEELLQDYAAPLFEAAGIRARSVEIFIVPDRTFNAFVADNKSIFITTGALIDSERPNQIIGVLAHEIAHLAGGDLAALRDTIRRTQIATIVGALVGLGGVVAGNAAGIRGLGEAGMGVIGGVQEAGRRSILAYARGEETTADQAAVRYLRATGQSPQGMLEVFERLANQGLLALRTADPYLQSHPLPRERIAQIQALVAESPHRDRRDPAALQLRHDLARAKLIGFTAPQQVERVFGREGGLPAQYARAIAAYRTAGLERALPLIDALIAADGNNPFFHELKGQALLERGRPREAIEPLRRAVRLDSNGLLRILLGHALVESGNPDLINEAIDQLDRGLQDDPNQSLGYRILARAYAQRGDIGMAQLSTAQGFFIDGQIDEARLQASRAQAKLSRGSPAWLRADDIVTYQPPRFR